MPRRDVVNTVLQIIGRKMRAVFKIEAKHIDILQILFLSAIMVIQVMWRHIRTLPKDVEEKYLI